MIADPNANRVIVPPQRITDIPVYSPAESGSDKAAAKPKTKTYKLQFQAPPMPGEMKVHAYFVSDSYLACSVDLPVMVSLDVDTAVTRC
jgi:translocation protein SEC63